MVNAQLLEGASDLREVHLVDFAPSLWGRKLPLEVNKLKIETSISLRVRDEEVKIYGKSDCWNIG